MSKLTRVFQNLFGRDGNQSHFGEFGSRALGAPVNTKDPNTIQALSAFVNNGWLDAINGANKAPFLEDMNALCYLLFYQIAYGFQEGVPEWDSGTNYFTGSIVKKTGTFEQYGSLIDNNTGNALPNQTDNGSWHYLNPATIAPGIMSDFGGTVAPFGWLLCDGSVYAQASYAALFAAIGSNWNTGGEGAGNFRVPDMRGRASIGAGQGSGLSNRTLAQLIGEETHILVTGEMPVHNHGVTDPGHNHQDYATGPAGQVTNGGAGQNTMGRTTLGNLNVQAATTGISTGNTGGGAAHNNMQPSGVVMKIIKI